MITIRRDNEVLAVLNTAENSQRILQQAFHLAQALKGNQIQLDNPIIPVTVYEDDIPF